MKDSEISIILFGRGRELNISNMARHTGIPRGTLQRYKKLPGTIPLDCFQRIAKYRQLSMEDIYKCIH